MNKYFTREDAQSKLGKSIKSKVPFADVPTGTSGYVVNTYHYTGTKNYGVEIKWGLDHHLVDGFSKDEYDELLEEL